MMIAQKLKQSSKTPTISVRYVLVQELIVWPPETLFIILNAFVLGFKETIKSPIRFKIHRPSMCDTIVSNAEETTAKFQLSR